MIIIIVIENFVLSVILCFVVINLVFFQTKNLLNNANANEYFTIII